MDVWSVYKRPRFPVNSSAVPDVNSTDGTNAGIAVGIIGDVFFIFETAKEIPGIRNYLSEDEALTVRSHLYKLDITISRKPVSGVSRTDGGLICAENIASRLLFLR